MKSGNFGAVTVGTGTTFGAHALASVVTTIHAEIAEYAENRLLCGLSGDRSDAIRKAL